MRPVLAFLPLALAACAAAPAPLAMPARDPAPRCLEAAWLEPGKPLIRVTVNGKPLTFFVDSGADHDGWIKPEVAAELGLPVVGAVAAQEPDDPVAGAPLFGIDRFGIGGESFAGLRFGSLEAFGSALPFDGIVGNALLGRFQAIFDYRANRLVLTDAPLTQGSAVKFEFGIPTVTLDIGGRALEAHLDTGNMAGALRVPEAFARSLTFTAPPTTRGQAVTAEGAMATMEAPIAESVRFAGTVLPVTTVRWPGAFGEAQLGSKALAGLVVRIDARRQRVAIAPEDGPVGCSV